MKKLVSFFISWKALIYLFAFIAILIVPFRNVTTLYYKSLYFEFGNKLPYQVLIWANFDGLRYLDIAKDVAYQPYRLPFFPLYPLTIRLLTRLTYMPYVISGQLISSVALFISLIFIYKLLVIDKKKNLFNLLALALLLFPTSFFYSAVYNDSLFLLFATATIYCARKRSWLWSSIYGGLATLTRLNGLALCFIIFFEYLNNSDQIQNQWQYKNLIAALKKSFSLRKIFESKIYSIGLIPLAFLSYLLYIQLTFGNWGLLFSSMKLWNQDKITFPLQVFFRYAKIIFLNSPTQLNYWIAFLELSFVLFYVFLIIYSFRKIRLSYWLFFVTSIIIPSLTGTFQGMPRYALHLYPFFLSLAILLEKRSLLFKIIYFTISIGLLFVYVTLFTRGYFIA